MIATPAPEYRALHCVTNDMDVHGRLRGQERERAEASVPSADHATTLQRTASNAALSRMIARAPAPAPASAPGKADPRVDGLEARVTRLENQQRATLHLGGFRDAVLKRITGWERAIIKLGSAYATAARNHTDAVEAKKKGDAIKSQMMFSVLTVASAGGLAWLSGTAQAANGAGEASLLTNVLEDVLQNSLAETLSANGPGVHQRVPTPDQTTVSTDPLVFQNERMLRLKAAQERAHAHFEVFNDMIVLTRPESWDEYDEGAQVGQYEAWLARADTLKAEAAMPAVDEMAAELERGFWAKWAPALKKQLGDIDNNETYGYTSPGKAVEERLTALGITKASGVKDFGWWTTDKEIQMVIDWANSYQVKQFG